MPANNNAVAVALDAGESVAIGGATVVALKRQDNPTGDGMFVASNIDDLVNRAIQRHAAQAVDWDHAELAAVLANWAERFNAEFFAGVLPAAAISIERDRVTRLGWYLVVRDGLGLRYRININELYLSRPLACTLETLLHELVHLWEDAVRGRRKGGAYHTKAFRTKTAALGIPSDRYGCSLGATPDGRFAQLLGRHGVLLEKRTGSAAEASAPVRAVVRGPGSRLAKWSCACTNVRVSSGVLLAATCHRCGGPFVRQERGGV